MIADLLSVQLFRDLSCDEIEAVARFSRHVVLGDGEFLIREEDTQFDLFVLLHGGVEIISSQRSVTSEECVLSRASKEVLGEIGWLTQCRRTAAVRCHGAVEAICIDGKLLSQFLAENPAAGFTVMRNVALLMAQRLAATDTLLKQILWNAIL